MKKKLYDFTQNREVSWLRFNQRVLEEAKDDALPLLERMKFVSIFTSNLDEFFMVRVGSLYDMSMLETDTSDRWSGMNAKEQLDKIYETVAPLYKERDETYTTIKKLLVPYGICGLDFSDLETKEKKHIRKYFKEQIKPILSPQIVDANHPFPHLLNKEVYVICTLEQKGSQMIGLVPVPQFISDILYLPGEDMRYIRMEKIILEYLEDIFELYEVSGKNYICVTRNADISADDEALDINEDFRSRMKVALHKRKRMAVVRLEIAKALSPHMETYLCDKFHITKTQIFKTKVPMKLSYVFGVTGKLSPSLKRALTDAPFSPQPAMMCRDKDVMKQVKNKDVLLSYPYEKMSPFLNLIKEASQDPSVLTIKITIYRLASKARLVEYLCAAAENGKEVTVLIELRARFDEQNNIDWSERLEEAGCRIIYGFDGYKVHSKLCLITYRDKNEIKYITQVGTGNYNEKTATMYTDVSLMTANQEIGADAAEFFKNMSIGNLEGSYRKLIVAPVSLKQRVLHLMDREIEKGTNGRVIMKMNSVTDKEFILKIAEASKTGVKIDLMVRGICCILPGVEGSTDNLRVTSIVGRYLEHPRIFSFGKGAEQEIYIGSADMMTRNTEKRVEVACPILDDDIKNRLNRMLTLMLKDNIKGRMMMNDGTYCKIPVAQTAVNAQEALMQEAMNAVQKEVEEVKLNWFQRLFLRKK
ncbi:MAG: polyphosphate kinase 1 [Eubacteriales bacterium]